MNYFAHARLLLHDPYQLAGVALPDWLKVCDRRLRVRSRQAAPFLDSPDPRMASLAAGIVRHHRDDGWFHATLAFQRGNVEMTALLRNALPDDGGFRLGFLGHILIELLLDAHLIEQQPERLAAYYEALAEVDGAWVQHAVGQMAARPPSGLAELIPGFCQARFLFDYLEDGKLCFRLNQVMWRVGLPPLPASLREVLPEARRYVAARVAELLAEPEDAEVRPDAAVAGS